MSTVTMPRGVLVALVALLLLSLGLAAFLAGRASAPAPPAATAVSPAAAPPTVEAAPPPDAAATPAAPAAVYPGVHEGEPAPAAVPRPGSAPAGVALALPPPAPEDAARVSRYFQEMEAAQESAKYWTDPQALAGTLVDGLSKGDRSGIDRLIGSTRAAVERMSALDVPPDCGEHHRRSLDLVAQGIALLESIATGATAGDLDAFSAIPPRARQLEAEAKDVDALAARIKQRYGVS